MKSKNKQIVRDLINKTPAKKIKNIIAKTAEGIAEGIIDTYTFADSEKIVLINEEDVPFEVHELSNKIESAELFASMEQLTHSSLNYKINEAGKRVFSKICKIPRIITLKVLSLLVPKKLVSKLVKKYVVESVDRVDNVVSLKALESDQRMIVQGTGIAEDVKVNTVISCS